MVSLDLFHQGTTIMKYKDLRNKILNEGAVIHIPCSETDRLYNSFNTQFFPESFKNEGINIKDVLTNNILNKGFIVSSTENENFLLTRFRLKSSGHGIEIKVELDGTETKLAETLSLLLVSVFIFIQNCHDEGNIESAYNACDFLIPFTLDCNQNS